MAYWPTILGGGGSGSVIPTPTLLGYPLDIWVALRTDGVSGNGAITNPYNLSTAALVDTFFNTTLPALAPSGGAHIHFGPGTFPTYGSPNNFSSVAHGFNLPGGNWYEGAGLTLSTIQQFALPDSGQIVMFQTLATTDNKNTRISGFTFDANWPTLGSGSPPSTSVANFLEIDGTTGCEVFNCAFKNGYGNFANGQEHFGCKISSPTLSGIVTALTNASIHNCWFSAFQGDYGTACDIFSLGANGGSTTVYNANSSIYENYFENYNHLQFSSATNTNCGCIGVTGSGFSIYGNRATNCNKFLYTEGPISQLQAHNNILRGIIIQAFNFNISGSNISLNLDTSDNFIEMSTMPLSTGSNINNLKAAFNGFGSSASNATRYRIKRNTVVWKQGTVATATRSRNGSNVATVTFSTAQNYQTGDIVDTSGFSGTGYNLGYVTVTRNSSTSFSFPSTGSSEGSTADTGGHLDCSTGGFLLNSGTAFLVDITDNQVDSKLYSVFAYTAPLTFVWHDNLTETGAPITLQPGTSNTLPSEVRWAAGSNVTTNGSNLVAAYTHASLIYPNGAAPSATNRVSLMIPAGNYTVTAGNSSGTATGSLIASNNFIDFIGQGSRDDTIITSSAQTFTIASSVSDYRLKNFQITTSDGSTVGSQDSSTTAAYWPLGSGGTAIILEDMRFNGAGTYNAWRGGQAFKGQAIRCDWANGGWPGHSNGNLANGAIIDNCTLGNNDTNYLGGTAQSYTIKNCNLAYRISFFNGNIGVIDHCTINVVTTSSHCIYEAGSNNTTAGGVTRYCTLIPLSPGKVYINNGGTRSTSIVQCNLFSALDSSITNSVTTPYNVVDSHILQ